jgi:hypothetical protein
MNRKRFTWLIIMMVVSLAGITGVQIYWVRNAVAIRNENFTNSVLSALQQTAGSLESSRRVAFFNDFVLRDRLWRDSLSGVTGVFSFGSYSSPEGGGFSLNITGETNYSVSQPGPTDQPDDVLNDEFLFGGMIPEGDSVTIVITSPEESSPITPVYPLPKSGTREQRVVISQDEYMGWLKKRASEFQRMSDQMISEMYDWEAKSELDDRLVKYTLDQVLSLHGIKTQYEFAIVRGNKISGGTYSPGNSKALLQNDYMVRLFPGRLIKDEVMLSVIFPHKRDYLLGSMTWLLVSSLLFS